MIKLKIKGSDIKTRQTWGKNPATLIHKTKKEYIRSREKRAVKSAVLEDVK